MNLQEGLELFQSNLKLITPNSPDIHKQITPNIPDIQAEKDLKWANFCEHEEIEEMYSRVGLNDLKGFHAVGKEQISQWIKNQDRNLILFGCAGSGKTHAGLAILRHYYEHKRHVRHIHDYNIIPKGKKEGVKFLKETYGDCDILMIDDFGVSGAPEWEMENYHAIIDMRFNRRKPTIITTNLNPQELEQKFKKRILSRLPAQWVRFEEIDYRSFGFKKVNR